MSYKGFKYNRTFIVDDKSHKIIFASNSTNFRYCLYVTWQPLALNIIYVTGQPTFPALHRIIPLHHLQEVWRLRRDIYGMQHLFTRYIKHCTLGNFTMNFKS